MISDNYDERFSHFSFWNKTSLENFQVQLNFWLDTSKLSISDSAQKKKTQDKFYHLSLTKNWNWTCTVEESCNGISNLTFSKFFK